MLRRFKVQPFCFSSQFSSGTVGIYNRQSRTWHRRRLLPLCSIRPHSPSGKPAKMWKIKKQVSYLPSTADGNQQYVFMDETISYQLPRPAILFQRRRPGMSAPHLASRSVDNSNGFAKKIEHETTRARARSCLLWGGASRLRSYLKLS